MIILTGASGSGKTETCRYLEKHYGIVKAITYTTRELRKGEVNGIDYHFVSDEVFDQMIEENRFIEHSAVNKHRYGTTKDEVKIDRCLAVDFKGAKTYHDFKNPRIVVFLMDASDEVRRKRMEGRGDDPKKIASRMADDRKDFELTDDIRSSFDYIIDTEKNNVAQCAEIVYREYQRILRERGVEFELVK